MTVGRIVVYSGADRLGDGLFKFPFITSLRATFPNAEICWLTSRGSAYNGVLSELAERYLDKVISKTNVAKSVLSIIWPPKFDLGPIDIFIDTQTVVPRTIALRRIFKARTFIAASADYRLSDIRPSQIGIDRRSKPLHLVDHLMLLLKLAARGDAVEDMRPVPIPDPYLRLAAKLLPDGESYVGFAPGSGDPTKRWPLDRYIALARKVVERGSIPVFFIGPSERDFLEAVRRELPSALFPEEAVSDNEAHGPLLVSALGRRLKAAVANDSGLGHMLALSSVPLILLFGRHTPAKYAPRVPALQHFWAMDNGGPELSRIPLAEVEKALLGVLDGARKIG